MAQEAKNHTTENATEDTDSPKSRLERRLSRSLDEREAAVERERAMQRAEFKGVESASSPSLSETLRTRFTNRLKEIHQELQFGGEKLVSADVVSELMERMSTSEPWPVNIDDVEKMCNKWDRGIEVDAFVHVLLDKLTASEGFLNRRNHEWIEVLSNHAR